MLKASFSRLSIVSLPVRHFAKGKNSYHARKAAFKAKLDAAQDELNNLPKFSNLIRQLYRRSHPDILRASHLEFAQINDQSMQILNSILTSIKTYNEYPPQIVKNVPFYLKTTGSDNLSCVELNIRTAGGDSKKQ